jgi:hypothetical protein
MTTTNTSTLDTGGWALSFLIAIYATHSLSRYKMEDSKMFQSLPENLWIRSRHLWWVWCLGKIFAGITILAILLNRHAFAVNAHGVIRDFDSPDGLYVNKIAALSFVALYLMQRFPDALVCADWWVSGEWKSSNKRVAPSTLDPRMLSKTYYADNKWGRALVGFYALTIFAIALAVLSLLGKQFIVNVPFQTAIAFWTMFTVVALLKVIVVGFAVLPKHNT